MINIKATVERDGCIACGLCIDICPEVFYMDNDGLASVKDEVSQELREPAIEARDACPVSVINIEE